MKKYFLALDIGGTKISGALFTDTGEIVADYVYTAATQTVKGQEAVYQNVKSVLDRVLIRFSLTKGNIAGIGVGSPGPLNTKTGVIIHAPLMGWKNFPVVQRLRRDFVGNVFLDNDGNLGALAEQRCGVAYGLKNVLYMTVSTGCGGGIIIGGKVYRGKDDSAGEFGHFSLKPNGIHCPCGSRGCFELYASGTAMNRKMIADMKNGIKSRVFELAEYNEVGVNGIVLAKAAQEGDIYALKLFRQEGKILGIGIANLFNVFNPDVFVLGGGVTKAKEYFHSALMLNLKKYSIQPIQPNSVRYSIMNDRVVLYGAYYLIKGSVLNL